MTIITSGAGLSASHFASRIKLLLWMDLWCVLPLPIHLVQLEIDAISLF
ncbi:hypothetical protein LINGRAHAP2_LOCUS19916 [Linum grandiflorum]